jgi:hypothetical protein
MMTLTTSPGKHKHRVGIDDHDDNDDKCSRVTVVGKHTGNDNVHAEDHDGAMQQDEEEEDKYNHGNRDDNNEDEEDSNSDARAARAKQQAKLERQRLRAMLEDPNCCHNLSRSLIVH